MLEFLGDAAESAETAGSYGLKVLTAADWILRACCPLELQGTLDSLRKSAIRKAGLESWVESYNRRLGGIDDRLLDIPQNDALERLVVRAWAKAAQDVIEEAVLATEGILRTNLLRPFRDRAFKKLGELSDAALDRHRPLPRSSLTGLVPHVLHGIGSYRVPRSVEASVGVAHADLFGPITDTFEPTLTELCGSVPREVVQLAKKGARTFGELVFAAFGKLLDLAGSESFRQYDVQRNLDQLRGICLAQEQANLAAEETRRSVETLVRWSEGLNESIRVAFDQLIDEYRNEAASEGAGVLASWLRSFEANGFEPAFVSDLFRQMPKRLDAVQRDLQEILDSVRIGEEIAIETPEIRASTDQRTEALRFSVRYAIDAYAGRDEDERILRETLLAPFDENRKPFQWLWLHAPAGSGKTRFAEELLRKPDPRWPVRGFVHDAFIDEEHGRRLARELRKPAFLVIDYASRRQEIHGFLKALAGVRKSPVVPIRALLIERQKDDPLFKALRECPALADFRAGDEGELTLRPLDETHLAKIMQERIDRVRAERGSTPSVPSETPESLLGLLNAVDNRRSPLAAAVLGDLIGRGELDRERYARSDAEESRRAIFGKLLEFERASLLKWIRSRKADENSLLGGVAAIVALACSQQGLDRKAVKQFAVSEKGRRHVGAEADSLLDGADRLLECDVAAKRFRPLQPDLLAERFFLEETDADFETKTGGRTYSNSALRATWLVKTAWRRDPVAMATFVRHCFQDYPREVARGELVSLAFRVNVPVRTICGLLRNLANDLSTFQIGRDPTDEEVRWAGDLLKLIAKRLITGKPISEEARNGDSLEHLAAAIYLLVQPLALALNARLPIEEVGGDESLAGRGGVLSVVQAKDPGLANAGRQTTAVPYVRERYAHAEEAVEALRLANDLLVRLRDMIASDDELGKRERLTRYVAFALGAVFASVYWEHRADTEAGGRASEPPTNADRDARDSSHFPVALALAGDSDRSPFVRSLGLHLVYMTLYARFGWSADLTPEREALRLLTRYVESPEELSLADHSPWAYFKTIEVAIYAYQKQQRSRSLDSEFLRRSTWAVSCSLDLLEAPPFAVDELSDADRGRALDAMARVLYETTVFALPGDRVERFLEACERHPLLTPRAWPLGPGRTATLFDQLFGASRQYRPEHALVWCERVAAWCDELPRSSDPLPAAQFDSLLAAVLAEPQSDSIGVAFWRLCEAGVPDWSSAKTRRRRLAGAITAAESGGWPISPRGASQVAEWIGDALEAAPLSDNSGAAGALSALMCRLGRRGDEEGCRRLMEQICRSDDQDHSAVRRSAVYRAIAVLARSRRTPLSEGTLDYFVRLVSLPAAAADPAFAAQGRLSAIAALSDRGIRPERFARDETSGETP